MSQGKTVIQGLDSAETNIGNFNGSNNSFYSRGGQASHERGTIVPGMEEAQTSQISNSSESVSTPNKRKIINNGKPVVGFLYSISRTPKGEYWPLTVGRNTIGSKAGVDIQLAEGTVSSEHAVIIVRQIKNTGGVIAAITDSMSTNGTMINGETIGFTATECNNGDIITIGNNYELVILLIDASKLGLSVSKDFISIEVPSPEDDVTDIPPFISEGTRPEGREGFSPFNNGSMPWNNGGYTPSDGTVGMDGSISGNDHGGTIPM